MHPVLDINHLIHARDHGLPVPQLTSPRFSDGTPNLTDVHYWTCAAAADLEPLALEDHPQLPLQLGNCLDCYQQLQQTPEGFAIARALLALGAVCADAKALAEVVRVLQDLHTYKNGQAWSDFLDDYTRARTLQTAWTRNGPEDMERGLRLDRDDPNLGALGEHVLDLVEDYRRQVRRLLSGTPVSDTLRDAIPSEPQVRAVQLQCEEGVAADGGWREAEEAALISEADVLAYGPDGWRLITWDGQLYRYSNDASEAPAGTHAQEELDMALHLFAQNPTGPHLEEILDAVRVALQA